jgi:ADP-heptose:LPS heptosyltransferase
MQRRLKQKKILGYAGSATDKRLTLPVELPKNTRKHEVEYCCDLLNPLDINSPIPPAQLIVTTDEQRRFLDSQPANLRPPFLGVHISARKPSNRWTEENFIELIHKLWEKEPLPIALFWSPGSENHPQHPGDDEMAERILNACSDVEIYPMRTMSLRELIVGMSFCDKVFCSDGGAMHVAAGLGEPIVCLFGDSDPVRWGPWAVPHQILQSKFRKASDVTSDQVMNAFTKLN